MRWRRRNNMELISIVLAAMLLGLCDCARRPAQRRQDTARTAELYEPTPSAESLQALAEAMGAAGFEHYTEGRPLVKRLIPADSHPDLDVQGVIGKAGVDFPAYPNIPSTEFNCKNVPTGYYADLETDCQVFHICDTSRKISFLCPNGTIFSQSHLICDWWFKVDCASAPALYESSAEYYSNEQKKSQKTSQNHKQQDLQLIGDSQIRAESRRSTVNVPSTTERLQRHRQKLQTEKPFNVPTGRNLHTLFDFNPTQRTQETTSFENRRRNLVQLITNSFTVPKPTLPTYLEAPKVPTEIKEMQVAAETASFANNNNRQFLQNLHTKNYRPYPVYTPNTPKPKPRINPNLTTLYDIRDKHLAQETQETTKRPTLVPYTKSFTAYQRHEPYTRPGVSALKGFLEKEKNKSLTTTTEKIPETTERVYEVESKTDKVVIETKNSFESVTKIPQTTRSEGVSFTETTTTAKQNDEFSTTNQVSEATTEPSYKDRRERLLRKLNLESIESTEAPTVTTTEKFYENQPLRTGRIVPPSLTPKSLHSLAIYYATGLDNLATTSTTEETETTTSGFDDYEAMEEALPGLFSQKTIHKYSNLFEQGTEQAELIEEMKAELNNTFGAFSEDLMVQQSQNPFASSPQVRELAQVFTHALSAYLQDPVQFRKVLSDIRPTHPSFSDLLPTTEEAINTEPTTTINEEDDEILGFSDDSKRVNNAPSVREPKALAISTKYSDATATTYTPEVVATTQTQTTPRNPFRCCGRISASYTKAPPPPNASTTPYTVAFEVNTLNNLNSEQTTDYSVPKYGGFHNNALTVSDAPYGNSINFTGNQPLDEYVEATNLPTAWGIDTSASTSYPTTIEDFESKRIRTSTVIPTTTPVYFTETDSVELENEEELQRAHSQSFVGTQNSRQGKQINLDETGNKIGDSEAPTTADFELTTAIPTTQPPTTTRVAESEILTTAPTSDSVFTSPDTDKTTYQQWSTFDNWQSTFIDPITLNDGLSPTGPDNSLRDEMYNSATTTISEYQTTEQTTTANIEASTENQNDIRVGRLLKDSSTEPSQDLSAITDTVVEKAKEIMGGMNSTTTEKLMNVMKKTKSKTVKRLILLLIQTCDDDHNSTAEASKKALLEALMAVSQKDMEEIAKEEMTEPTTIAENEYKTSDNRRMDRHEIIPRQFERRGKSINLDPSVINSLMSTTETSKIEDLRPVSTTFSPRTTAGRRGHRKYKTTPEVRTTKVPNFDKPIAEARVATSDLKTAPDTRALELLKSLYSIAARWG
ncbi:mucin-2 [Bombyx mori]|uniref:Chitin-binding type-2 domain-containing protein n=1 Tax=Bombyx mori TaxID=7091 RepID=A0A8R2LWA0_BOMMO|nr:mucin-5AC [Bombyx mori]XP_021209196.2 mucin-5AC [Bombyx mori]XP_037867961.1 mucin-5AC [Bombyx mori]XP_037867962.1 mucin-5AC [Bombyx mori]